jgi:hypothetical protein
MSRNPFFGKRTQKSPAQALNEIRSLILQNEELSTKQIAARVESDKNVDPKRKSELRVAMSTLGRAVNNNSKQIDDLIKKYVVANLPGLKFRGLASQQEKVTAIERAEGEQRIQDSLNTNRRANAEDLCSMRQMLEDPLLW